MTILGVILVGVLVVYNVIKKAQAEQDEEKKKKKEKKESKVNRKPNPKKGK